MSIQSTQYITREDAIERIIHIETLKNTWDFKEIERITFEPDLDVVDFISSKTLYFKHIENWTDRMLGDQMDEPFYRKSMFDNYLISIREDDQSW